MRQLIQPPGMLRLSWYLPQTECLGSGTRFALWVQGCERRCAGCIAPGLQTLDGGTSVSVADLAAAVIGTPDIEGVTVSGGEPFLQAEPLGALLRQVREQRPELGVIVYTGFCFEELRDDVDAQPLLRETDLLIDGAYIAALDDGRGLRGSSNQRLLFLTERYTQTELPQQRKTEFRFDGSKMRMIGIPSEGAKQMLALLRDGNRRNT